MRTEIDWQKYMAVIVCTVAAVGVLYLVLKYVLGLVLPFIIGWAVSLAVVPLSCKLESKCNKKISKKFWAILLIILIIVGILSALILGISRLMFEVQKLVERIGNDSGGDNLNEIVGSLILKVEEALSKIPLIGGFFEGERLASLKENINESISSSISDAISSLASKLPSFAAWLFGAAPSFFLFIAAVVISSFYFSVDHEGIRSGVASVCPKKLLSLYRSRKPKIKNYVSKYLRAYLLLFLMTAAELFIGFIVIGIDYALLFAILLAVLDLLPVLGVGTALIPWAAVSLLSGNVKIAVGLMILYGIMMIIRQLAEPKLVGKSLGVHPVLMLASVYISLKLFGLAGTFIGPAAAIMLRAFLGTGERTEIRKIK